MNFAKFFRFLLILLLFSGILYGIAYFAIQSWGSEAMLQATTYNFIYFFLITLITYPILIWALNKGGKGFMNVMYGGIFGKLLVSLIYLLFLFQSFKGEEFSFIFSFFIAYLLFTGFEIYLIMLNLRQISRSRKDAKSTENQDY